MIPQFFPGSAVRIDYIILLTELSEVDARFQILNSRIATEAPESCEYEGGDDHKCEYQEPSESQDISDGHEL